MTHGRLEPFRVDGRMEDKDSLVDGRMEDKASLVDGRMED